LGSIAPAGLVPRYHQYICAYMSSRLCDADHSEPDHFVTAVESVNKGANYNRRGGDNAP
jgi:hypothetical protein